MSADRELLELAAKAAEYVVDGYVDDMIIQPSMEKAGGLVIRNYRGGHSSWNPLTDDGDALRLAAKLKLNVMQGDFSVGVTDEAEIDAVSFVPDESQRLYAIRESIVRAAAEIGKAMP